MIDMADIITLTSKGQLTLPAGIRAKYGLKAGDKLFGEEIADGYIIRKPKKGLLDYKGFIKSAYLPEADREAVMEAVLDRVSGKD
jgi:AbrB family looped-hinge helix DNA binding protein